MIYKINLVKQKKQNRKGKIWVIICLPYKCIRKTNINPTSNIFFTLYTSQYNYALRIKLKILYVPFTFIDTNGKDVFYCSSIVPYLTHVGKLSFQKIFQ